MKYTRPWHSVLTLTMSHSKLRQHVSSCVSAITHQSFHHFPHPKITTVPPCSSQPKHPQHLLSLLLKDPSQSQAIQQVHSHIITSGLFHYASHNTLTCLLLFNNVIRCYSLGPFPHQALHFFTYTQHCHTFLTYPSLDSFSFAFLCHSCAHSNYTHFGIQLHALIFKVGFQFHVYVQTGLLQMYSSCGLLVEAAQVFYEMQQRSLVTWNVFITGLIRWGEVELACSVFYQMPARSVVSWTLVIDGYTRMNWPMKALTLFREMVECDGVEPTEVTLLTVFPAIANIGCVKICQSVHGYAEKRGFNAFDIRVVNALIDLYAKCGCIASASRFFQEIPDKRKNLVSWTTAISGFAMNGMGREAVESFESMEKDGMRPNRVTFLSVLSACSHGGLIEEGLKFFVKMVKDCQLVPDIKHYSCVIDMLGRAGRLEEAEKVALQVPHEVANAVMWRTLLGACSVHNNVEIGQRVTRKILEMERGHGGDYVLMSNILVGVGRFKDAERLREMIDKRIAFKLPGYSLF
ncbi:pentatricopeptide repeat-containing protein At1g09220, mitochondrial [Abrus precatorius]|uniref:Pentatricopeptide repeat-containing protein At1g09220, mitochondrial n=1 Tax=Abrus precatorius TaxID=3816 RepID=A0A8B8K357_ABRPR|nr:pentatricopeptide repeat-containing protein At1g09220, mitochondrial [Abrus precatorius]